MQGTASEQSGLWQLQSRQLFPRPPFLEVRPSGLLIVPVTAKLSTDGGLLGRVVAVPVSSGRRAGATRQCLRYWSVGYQLIEAQFPDVDGRGFRF